MATSKKQTIRIDDNFLPEIKRKWLRDHFDRADKKYLCIDVPDGRNDIAYVYCLVDDYYAPRANHTTRIKVFDVNLKTEKVYDNGELLDKEESWDFLNCTLGKEVADFFVDTFELKNEVQQYSYRRIRRMFDEIHKEADFAKMMKKAAESQVNASGAFTSNSITW